MSSSPNILYLHCHDAGRYVQPYHPSIPTPNIQRVAEEGVLFRQAHTTNPTCSPSRACLMTGQWAHVNGMLGLTHRGFRLHDYSHALPRFLADHDYETVLCGIQHIASDPVTPADAGYKQVRNRGGEFHPVTDAAVSFLRERPQEPFFLDVGYHPPHRAGEGFLTLVRRTDDRYSQVPAPLPDNPIVRDDMSLYEASVHSTDICFGRVLEALDESGLADKTLVIITTDHGIAFPHMKCNLTDHGTGVMLIMRGPGGFSGGKTIDGMVSQLDLFPTLCELTALRKPDWLQGKSLLPLVNGEVDEIHDALFTEVNFHAAYEPQRAIRTKRWKYIRRFDERDSAVLVNCDNSPTKRYLYDRGWRDQARPSELLFDLEFDPNETQNLAASPDHQEILAELREQLETWMRETDDLALAGGVIPPDGARLNSPDAYDASDSPTPS